jgi:UDP-glucose 6-dehydrogenase
MNKSIYRETLGTLLMAVDNFKAQSISLEIYQANVFKAENEIVSIEEKKLRALLQNHENQLELIRFTTGDENAIHAELDKFREELCLWL